MSVQSTILKSVVSRFTAHATQAVTLPIEQPQDEERIFLASIAHLPLDEQCKRIERRAMYQRMAHRQGIMEVEGSSYSQRNEWS